jgi:hypothetical protein
MKTITKLYNEIFNQALMPREESPVALEMLSRGKCKIETQAIQEQTVVCKMGVSA